MPYIDKLSRKSLDPKIEALADEVVSLTKKEDEFIAFAGILNYCCTRLTLLIFKGLFKKLRYYHVALVTGVFKNINDEFYRRIGSPYEDFCIDKNGDVDLYEVISGDIAAARETKRS